MYIIAKINGKLTAINGESPKPQRGETTQRRVKPYGLAATPSYNSPSPLAGRG